MKYKTLLCPDCGDVFLTRASASDRADEKGAFLFCSKPCAYNYRSKSDDLKAEVKLNREVAKAARRRGVTFEREMSGHLERVARREALKVIPSDLEWKPIPSLPGYFASICGLIRTPSGMAAISAVPSGYLYVAVARDGKKLTKRVNRLVCEAFHGSPSCRTLQAAHNNGDRGDNSAANLRWATAKENSLDKQRHGTQSRGSECVNSKLTEADVAHIRSAQARVGYRHILATKYGVSIGLISMIRAKNSQIWKHVQPTERRELAEFHLFGERS